LTRGRGTKLSDGIHGELLGDVDQDARIELPTLTAAQD